MDEEKVAPEEAAFSLPSGPGGSQGKLEKEKNRFQSSLQPAT